MRVVVVVGFKWKRSSSTCAVVVENHGEIIESNKKKIRRVSVWLCVCVCHTKGRRNERNKLGRGSRLLFTKACAKWRIHGTRRPPLDGWGIIDRDEKIHPKKKRRRRRGGDVWSHQSDSAQARRASPGNDFYTTTRHRHITQTMTYINSLLFFFSFFFVNFLLNGESIRTYHFVVLLSSHFFFTIFLGRWRERKEEENDWEEPELTATCATLQWKRTRWKEEKCCCCCCRQRFLVCCQTQNK